MPETTLGNAVGFLSAFGFFDVVLPFLLVFTVVFGVLEKTNFFGAGKKNLNAMVAFSIGFLVVAATQITAAIQLSIPKVAFILIFFISFLLIVGTLVGPSTTGLDIWSLIKGYTGSWAVFVIIAVSLLAIFLSSVGWLDPIVSFFKDNVGSPALSTLIFIGIMTAVVIWIIRSGSPTQPRT